MNKLNRIADILVYATSFILPFVFVPQIYILIAHKTTAGISILFLLLSALCQLIYLYKNIVVKQKSMIVSVLSNLIPLIILIFITVFYRYFLGV